MPGYNKGVRPLPGSIAELLQALDLEDDGTDAGINRQRLKRRGQCRESFWDELESTVERFWKAVGVVFIYEPSKEILDIGLQSWCRCLSMMTVWMTGQELSRPLCQASPRQDPGSSDCQGLESISGWFRIFLTVYQICWQKQKIVLNDFNFIHVVTASVFAYPGAMSMPLLVVQGWPHIQGACCMPNISKYHHSFLLVPLIPQQCDVKVGKWMWLLLGHW